MASDGIAVSKALSIIPDSTTGEMSENSLSCIPGLYAQGQHSVYLGWGLTEPYWDRFGKPDGLQASQEGC